MTNDLMLLMPLIIVCAGAVLLMLASAFDKLSHEIAAYGCAGVFAIAFLVQLAACVAGPTALFGELFKGILVVSNFSKVAGLVILACGFFTGSSE